MKNTIYYLLVSLFCFCSCDSYQLASQKEGLDSSGRIVIVPDIQFYTDNEEKFIYLDAIVNYCKEEQDKIYFLLQTGDVTNNNQPVQWENSQKLFFSQLPKVFPTIFCLGNHDYGDNGSSNKRQSLFPAELTPIMDTVMNNSLWDNYLRYVMVEKKKIAVLSLEFAPRNETLEWANGVIKANSNTPIIILTHAFLNNSGKIFDASDSLCDNKYSQKYYKMSGDYLNDSQEIFDKIIYNNPNVKMVICGHCGTKNYIDCLNIKNVKNENVCCIMVNYQHYRDGGAGNIGLLYYHQGQFILKSFNAVSRKFGKIDIPLDLAL